VDCDLFAVVDEDDDDDDDDDGDGDMISFL
jgi:hypothetical protein